MNERTELNMRWGQLNFMLTSFALGLLVFPTMQLYPSATALVTAAYVFLLGVFIWISFHVKYEEGDEA